MTGVLEATQRFFHLLERERDRKRWQLPKRVFRLWFLVGGNTMTLFKKKKRYYDVIEVYCRVLFFSGQQLYTMTH